MCPSAAIQFTTAERFEFDELKWHIDQLAIPLGAERSKLSQAALAKARGCAWKHSSVSGWSAGHKRYWYLHEAQFRKPPILRCSDV